MESLSAAGVPAFALRGSQGGWELDEGWRTRVLPIDTPAERPPTDLAAYWKASTEELRSRARYEATLHLEPGAAQSLRRWRMTSPVPGTGPDSAGWVTLRVEFDGEEQARFIGQRLAPRVDVVAPATLRDRVAADLAAATARALRRRGLAEGS